jgi:hypothetical protein
LPKNQHWEYGEAHPNSALYPDHELVYVVAQSENPGWSKWYYAARRESQNLYNWVFSDADMWPTITQTFVIKETDFDPDVSALYTVVGSALEVDQTLYPIPPTTDVDMAGYSAISTTRKDLADRELASLYCEVVIAYEKIDNAICGVELDEETGTARNFCQAKVLAGTAGSGVSGGGFAEVKPINTLWSIKTTRRAAGMAGSPGVIYESPVIIDYYWPAVLRPSPNGILKSPWEKADGTLEYFIFPQYTRYAYNGPCKGVKRERWIATNPTLTLPAVLDPMPIVYKGPNIQFSIPACLHGTYTFQEIVGTTDPVWKPGTFTHTFPATTFDDWPNQIVVSHSARRMYGGFLEQAIIIDRPV